jgi:hypothetical protein
MADVLSGDFTNILNFVSAAGGLGTAAMGLVDASKAFRGGPSNFGFGYIRAAVAPFVVGPTQAPRGFNNGVIWQTLKANWMNGVPMDEQKAKARSLIRLGLTQDNAPALAAAAGVDPPRLIAMAGKVRDGTPLQQQEINVLGEFDVIVCAVLDAAYERGDQKYRNACKLLAMLTSTLLGLFGGWIVFGGSAGTPFFHRWYFPLSLVVGLCGTPLAPVAKDLTTSLQTAVSAVGVFRR